MKLIIAGSRNIHLNHHTMDDMIRYTLGKDFEKVYEIVSGCATGIDQCGEEVAGIYNVLVRRFPADWDRYGKAAGPIRNSQMANYANALLLIWDGESKGSASMKAEMAKLDKPVYEVIIRRP